MGPPYGCDERHQWPRLRGERETTRKAKRLKPLLVQISSFSCREREREEEWGLGVMGGMEFIRFLRRGKEKTWYVVWGPLNGGRATWHDLRDLSFVSSKIFQNVI